MKSRVLTGLLIIVMLSSCSIGGGGPTPTPQPTATTKPNATAPLVASSTTAPATSPISPETPTVVTVWSPPSAMETGRVEADGFQVELDRVRVAAPAGVATPNTLVTVTTPSDPAPFEVTGFSSMVGNPVSIVLGEGDTQGEQPQEPVTVIFNLAGTELAASVSDEAPLGVVTQSEGSDEFTIEPSTWNPNTQTLSVTIDHLTKIWPWQWDLSKMYQPVLDFLRTTPGTTLGLTQPQPDCYGDALTLGSITYSIGQVRDQVAWPCLSKQGDQIALELNSNSILPWRARTAPAAPGSLPVIDDLSGLAVLEFYRLLFSSYSDREGLVVPGSSTTFLFDPTHPPQRVAMETDPGLYLMSALVYGIETLFTVTGTAVKLVDYASAFTCLSDLVKAGIDTDSARGVQNLITAVLSCFSATLEKLVGPSFPVRVALVVISVLTTGVGLVIGGIQGAIATIKGPVSFPIIISSTDSDGILGEWSGIHRGLTLNPDGTGEMYFGYFDSSCPFRVVRYALTFDPQDPPLTVTIASRTLQEDESCSTPLDPTGLPDSGTSFTIAMVPYDGLPQLVIDMPWPGRSETDGFYDIAFCLPGEWDGDCGPKSHPD